MESELTVIEHIRLAEQHTQKALDLAHDGGRSQSFYVRIVIGRAQTLLIGLLSRGLIRE